jgi:hypothetical protein
MELKYDRTKKIIELMLKYKDKKPEEINDQSFSDEILSNIAQEGDPDYIHDIFIVTKLCADLDTLKGHRILGSLRKFVIKSLDIMFEYDRNNQKTKEEKYAEMKEISKFINKIKEEI